MPKVMLRRDAAGEMTLYVPKRDLEDTVVSMEFDEDDKWGGEIKLGDGSSFWVEPIARPTLPITLRAKRAGEDD
jgi:nitrogen fixation protein NifT